MKYGWIPSLPDPRDHTWLLSLEERLVPLPAEFSLRGSMPAVYNQGHLGSCTANAISACVQFQQMKQGETEGESTPSRLFIYWNERSMEGTVNSDSGAQIRDGMKVIASIGAPPESDWPYDVNKFQERPPDPVFQDAKKYLAKYGRVTQSAHSFQASVFFHRPVVFGFAVFESFETIGSDGIMPFPNIQSERVLGGHAVVITGYKPIDGHLYFEVRNSWGPNWGDSGYFYMPARYAVTPEFANDFWHINVES